MSEQGMAQTTCDWNMMQSGGDSVAQVTLHGGNNVYASCSFSGPDSIVLVKGNKHAIFKPLVRPGNGFSFEINYLKTSDTNDDNQNILFYLDTRNPGYSDQLSCYFFSM
jgi:hypothetical protein